MNNIVTYQWELFIAAEILSLLFLILCLLFRYGFKRQSISVLFLLLFLLCMAFEAAIAGLVYRHTGEISSFQIIIFIFLIYACTYGISDFKKLDRFMKKKIGQWRGENLLTPTDIQRMEQEKDPRFIARRDRRNWYIHVLLFAGVHYFFWLFFGTHDKPFIEYLTDLSWLEASKEVPDNGPFAEPAIYPISFIWCIVFVADTLSCWYNTFFPDKKKAEEKAS